MHTGRIMMSGISKNYYSTDAFDALEKIQERSRKEKEAIKKSASTNLAEIIKEIENKRSNYRGRKCIVPGCRRIQYDGHIKCKKHVKLCPTCLEREWEERFGGYCETCFRKHQKRAQGKE